MYIFLTNKNTSRRQYLIGFFMLVFFVIFSNVYSSIPGINNMNAGRFYGIIFALFAGGVAYGLWYFSSRIQNTFRKKHLTQGIIIVFCLLLLLSPCVTYAAENDALSVLQIPGTTPSATVNNHFGTSDMAMTSFSAKILPDTSYLMSDGDTRRYMLYEMPLATSCSILDLFTSEGIPDEGTHNTYILFRKEHFEERGFKIASTGFYIPVFADQERVTAFSKNTYNYNIMYTNGGSIMYST